MSGSIPGNTGKVKNRSYQDLAKENAIMLEALKSFVFRSDCDCEPPDIEKCDFCVAEEVVAKVEGK